MDDDIVEEIVEDELMSVDEEMEITQDHEYKSEMEKEFMEDLLNINLQDAENELASRVITERRNLGESPSVSAFYRHVKIRDKDGTIRVIDNWEDIRRRARKNLGIKKGDNPTTHIVKDTLPSVDDDVDFDF